MTGECCTSNRWSHWFGSLVFSIVALVALTTSWTDGLKDQGDENKWVFSALVTALCLSGLAVLAHGAQDKFIGTPVELGLAFIVMAITAAALPAIMKPDNGIAVDMQGGILNTNLYFFSWGTFFAALFAFIHFMQHVYNVGAGTKNTKFMRGHWVVLIATSLIAMASGARLWKLHKCQELGDISESHCRRLEYSFSLGVISGVISFIWLLVGARFHVMLDAFLSVVMLVLWSFAVAYSTFGGTKAPAYNLGNLYFSTWISFVTSCMLTSAAIHNMFTSTDEAEGGDCATPKEAEKDDKHKDEKADEEAGPAAEEHNA